MVITRLVRLWGVVKEASGDRYVQGRAAQLAGGALIADGLIGLENPLKRKQSRVGIFGSLVPIVVGVIFLFVATTFLSEMTPYKDGVMTTGNVTDVNRSTSRDSDGNQTTTCGVIVDYEVDGVKYTVQSSYSSNSFCGLQGRSIEVSYRPEVPAEGRIITGETKLVRNIFFWSGLFAVVSGLGLFVVRLGSIVFGVWLFFWGKKRAAGAAEQDVRGVLERLQDAWGSAEPDVSHAHAIPHLGSIVGSVFGGSERQGGSGDVSQVSAQPSSPPGVVAGGPPPGWFPCPRGDGERWWDGQKWTEHVRLGPPPSV